MSDLFGGGNRLSKLLELSNNGINTLVDSTPDVHRVKTSSNLLYTFGEEFQGQDGSGSGTISSLVVGLAGYRLDELSTNVLERVAEINALGDSYSVLGDLWRTITAGDDNVSALQVLDRAKGEERIDVKSSNIP